MDPKRYEAPAPEDRARVARLLAEALSTEMDVAFAYLFGSFADPEAEAFHDVDVAVYLRPLPTAGGTERALALADRLGARLGLPVEVAVLNRAPVAFRYHVLRGVLLLSREEELLGEVMERTIAEYLDLAPVLRRATREAFIP